MHGVIEARYLLCDATGQRGFLITGETSFLEPYKAANARVGLRLEDLEGLVLKP